MGGSTAPGSSGPTEGSTAPGSSGPTDGSTGQTSTAGTTSDPEDVIAQANAKIAELDNKISEETTKKSTAASASTKVDEINSALSTRIKRQAASTTPAAGSCAEFTYNFVQLLDLLQALSDDDLDQVKILVTFFTTTLPNIPCTSTEKTTIKNDNAAKVTAAQAGVDTYKNEKDIIIIGYHEEVKKEKEKIDNANEILATMGSPTIAASTVGFTSPEYPPTNGAATSAAPGSSGPTDGSTAPGSSGPTEGSSAPGSSGPTDGSTAPSSTAPGSSDPTPTGGVTSTVSSGGRRSRRFLQNLPLFWERK